MTLNKRLLGWYFFDWASQPVHTVLLTFVFGPFFALVAMTYFAGTGLDEQAADARAQSLWSFVLAIAGLAVGLLAPFLGALADGTGRRMLWIAGFTVLGVAGAAGLWVTALDGSNLGFALCCFGLALVMAEFAQIFTNAQLPGLASKDEAGGFSGSGFAFGYLGGFIALVIALAVFVEGENGRTVLGVSPGFGLFEPETREGTRAVGPFVAVWFAVFMVPYFLWVREDRTAQRGGRIRPVQRVVESVKALRHRRSLASFLAGSMLYRDALNGLYGFGGTYAFLALDWEVSKVGVFGIVTVISAAFLSWVGGRLDRRFGPKPVIVGALLVLLAVCVTLAGLSKQGLFGIGFAPGSSMADAIFMGCGVLIGGFGGITQAASRSMMVRHADPGAETEAFGLYGLAGRATSFLAPSLIGLTIFVAGDVRFGVAPLILLFLLGLVLLGWTKREGDRAGAWSDTSFTSS